jgi:hypothetical protein
MMQGILSEDNLEAAEKHKTTYFLKKRITIEVMLEHINCGDNMRITSAAV